jgi:CDP-diglyceride synthetase
MIAVLKVIAGALLGVVFAVLLATYAFMVVLLAQLWSPWAYSLAIGIPVAVIASVILLFGNLDEEYGADDGPE